LLLFRSSFTKKNEIKALAVLAMLFLISSILVEYDSITSILYKTKLTTSSTYIAISFVQGFIFLILTIYKFSLAKKLNYNSTLLIDIFNTTITFIDCFAMAIGMLIYEHYPNIWAFDAICGIITGFFIFIYALQIIHEIYTKVKKN
jgi:divalent metal cation (Fe/Co/Zn/Cd) transporter